MITEQIFLGLLAVRTSAYLLVLTVGAREEYRTVIIHARVHSRVVDTFRLMSANHGSDKNNYL